MWKEGRVAAKVSPHWLQWRAQIRHQKYPFPWTDPQTALRAPHPWTRPTYGAKRHPDPIRRFSTMHWTDRRTHVRTDRQIVHGKV